MQANIHSVACVHVYLSPRAVITNGHRLRGFSSQNLTVPALGTRTLR